MNENQFHRLERLATLRDKGVLTDDEFERSKAAILAETDAPPPSPEPSPSIDNEARVLDEDLGQASARRGDRRSQGQQLIVLQNGGGCTTSIIAIIILIAIIGTISQCMTAPRSENEGRLLTSSSYIYPEGEFVRDAAAIAEQCVEIDGFAGIALAQASTSVLGRTPTAQELYDIGVGSLEYRPVLANGVCTLSLSFKSRAKGATPQTSTCRVTGLELQANRDVAVSFCE